MKRIGLTGGIGCGKSTVVAELRRQGVPCFVADEVARAYYDDPAFVAQVQSLFDSPVLTADGKVNRKAIASAVFSDKSKLQQLNALIHPRVMHDFERWCNQQQGQPVVFFESAILYECGLEKAMDAVVAVYLEKEERIRRLMVRDHCAAEAIEARMCNQMPDEEKAMRADYVILNYEGNPRERQVRRIVELLIG